MNSAKKTFIFFKERYNIITPIITKPHTHRAFGRYPCWVFVAMGTVFIICLLLFPHCIRGLDVPPEWARGGLLWKEYLQKQGDNILLNQDEEKEMFWDAPVDHFNPTFRNKTFPQRYYVNDEYFDHTQG